MKRLKNKLSFKLVNMSKMTVTEQAINEDLVSIRTFIRPYLITDNSKRNQGKSFYNSLNSGNVFESFETDQENTQSINKEKKKRRKFKGSLIELKFNNQMTNGKSLLKEEHKQQDLTKKTQANAKRLFTKRIIKMLKR